ncbi:MAG: DUF4041 domain-containing protein [Verrucomicrobiota bacterium]|jgi:hypothetical protein
MTVVFAIIALVCIGLLIAVMFINKKLEGQAAAANQESERLRQYYDSETQRVYREAQVAVADAQKQIDQQFGELKQESERIRQHYETETRKAQEAADALVAKTIKEFEPLRKFEKLRDAEVEAQRQLADALKEATNLRAEAQSLMEQAKIASADERLAAEEKVKDIHDQADACLNQAIRDAGRIMAQAEERAEQIGGDAYRALREKDTLEQAAEAMRNKIEGYGDRYLVPAHSVLDDLADKFGYDAAGQALKSARALSARMVEQGEAATCDYAEANRRKTAIQFVVHAFNGEVDSILSKVMSDNSGTLAQKIRDAFSTVNRDGSAFRNARILPAFLDARLAELDSATRMREFVQKVRDEQRAERERIRDEQKAEQERQEKLRAAAREEELKRTALEAAERRYSDEIAELKAEHEKQLTEAGQIGIAAVDEALKRHADEIAQLNAKHSQQIAQKNQELEEAMQKKIGIQSQTRAGNIYIISNEGSFGPDVYKIGFTRRDPEVRVGELYNASVPFEFEIHGVITAENAPELEYILHKHFLAQRWNKKNFGKEFFRVALKDVRRTVEKLAQEKDFTDKLSWRETEAGRAAEWQECREIENDPEAREKWLTREQAAVDERWRKRERRLANRRAQGALAPLDSDVVV